MLVVREQLDPAERKWSPIMSIMKWILKSFFPEFKTENFTEMEGSNNVHPEQIMVTGKLLSSLLPAEFKEFGNLAPR